MPIIQSGKKKTIVVAVIVVFWLAMSAELMRREVLLPSLPAGSTSIAASLTPDMSFKEQWMGIYYEGEKVGYSNTTVNRVNGENEPGYLILNRTFMVVTMLGNPLKVHFEGLLRTDPEFKMRTFNSRLESLGHEIQLDGRLDGDILSLSVVSGGKVFRKTARVDEGLNLSNSLTPMLFLPDLKPGTTYSVDILDPLSLATTRAKVTVKGMEPLEFEGTHIDAYVVETEYQGLSFTAWVTEAGEVLKETTPLGWTLLREDRNVAAAFRTDATEFHHDIGKLVSVPANLRIDEPEQIRRMDLRISGIDLNEFNLEGAGQQLVDKESGLVRIRQRQPQDESAPTIPVDDESLSEFLSSSLLIQADDPKIKKMALRIADGEKNSLLVAERINRWLFDNIQKKITMSLPSAVEVLETREGDCNEHTTLFTALARSIGIPTRMVVGLVYHKGSFYYHAWPEVYVGEWVAMDPTLGEPLADATHIKLLEGELDQQARLVQAIGKIKVTIDSFSYDPPASGDEAT